MKKLALLAGAGLLTLGTIGSAQAQAITNHHGYYGHHRAINGGAVAAGLVGGAIVGGIIGAATAPAYAYPSYSYGYGYDAEPVAQPRVVYEAPRVVGRTQIVGEVSSTPNSLFPYAAPHEIRYVNGVPCRTIYDHGKRQRVIAACAR